MAQHSRSYDYLLLAVSPPSDALTLRKALQESLTLSFGIIFSKSHLDILWVAENGSEVIIRTSLMYSIPFFVNQLKNIELAIQGLGEDMGGRCCVSCITQVIFGQTIHVSSIVTSVYEPII